MVEQTILPFSRWRAPDVPFKIDPPLVAKTATTQSAVPDDDQAVPGPASSKESVEIHDVTEGGVAANHKGVDGANVLVAPSTANETNRIIAGLIPIACWRVDDVRFDFDSSFVLPAVAEEIAALSKLREAHKKPVVPRTDLKLPQFIFPPLSVFGHADPVGQDDYNKFLSGRRAAAIYGMLTRRDEIWEDLFSNKGEFTGSAAGDKWGTRVIQTMLTELGFASGKSGDQSDSDETSAVREFQSSQGLATDGNAGQQTRKKLFARGRSRGQRRLSGLRRIQSNTDLFRPGEPEV
jgi:outer membrane protein OmpA-like peptidoglycan-associated protein